MPLVDEEGRILGWINVVDALVLCLVIALALAGAALVAGGDDDSSSSPSDSTSTSSPPSSSSGALNSEYVTLTIGPISEDASTSLSSGDPLELPRNDTTLRITDLYRTPHPTGTGVITVVRAEVQHLGGPLPSDRGIDVESDQYTYNASVSGFTNSSRLARNRTSVTVRADVPDQLATAIRTGDTYTIANEDVAEVTSVRRLSSSDGNRRIAMGLELETLHPGGPPQFAGRPVRIGTTVPFQTDEYTLDVSVTSFESPSDEQRPLTVSVQTVVPRSVAGTVERGDEFRIDGRLVARIESVSSIPITDRERRRLELEVTLQTVRAEGERWFLGNRVRIGSTIPFETGEYRLNGTVIGLGGTQPGTPVNATLHVRWENVRPELADVLRPGMAERHRGADASIDDVSTEPATVILRTETGEVFAREHPVNRDVTITLSVRARRGEGTLYFHGRPLQSGDDVVLDFGSVTVDGTVTNLSVTD